MWDMPYVNNVASVRAKFHLRIFFFLLEIVCRGCKDGSTMNSDPCSVIVWLKRTHNKSLVRET